MIIYYLFILSISFFILFITYKYFFQKLILFIINLVLLVSNITLLIFEKDNNYFNILIFSNIIISLSFLISIFNFFIIFKNFKTQVLLKNTIEKQNNKFYLILNKNLKIINISTSLLEEFGLKSLFKYRFKNLIYLLNDKIRIDKKNQEKASNKEFIIYLKELVNKKNDVYFSLIFYNYLGKVVELKIFLNNKDNYFKTLYGTIESNPSNFSNDLKLKELEYDFNQIYDKFINTTNLIKQGIYIYDLEEQSIWLSQKFKEMLDLEQSIEVLDYKTFKSLIHPDDLKSFNLKLSNINDLDNFELSFRLKVNSNYIWFLENSKKTKIDNKETIISAIEIINTNNFSKHSIDNLDNLRQDFELTSHIDKLIKDEIPFLLASIKITNLKEINDKYSRQVANMALSEYIRKIKERFVTKSGDIFRLSGSRFVFTITDIRNLGLIKEGFLKNENYLNMTFNYGTYSFYLNIKAGVSIFKRACYNTTEVINASKNALEVALNKDYSKNIYIHGDLKNEKRIM